VLLICPLLKVRCDIAVTCTVTKSITEAITLSCCYCYKISGKRLPNIFNYVCSCVCRFLVAFRPRFMHAVHKMRPIATDVARSVVCLSVCWSHGCAVQKRLNWSRCHLGADLCRSMDPRSDKCIRHREGWQFGDAAICQITLDTCLRYVFIVLSLYVFVTVCCLVSIVNDGDGGGNVKTAIISISVSARLLIIKRSI